MVQQLKAIETAYNGYLFRSRLEARWATFFDTAGIEYRYEPEGFDLDGLWYLPDFWLPTQDCWIEIKPTRPNDEEYEKARRLLVASRKHVYLFWGDIPLPSAWRGVDGADRLDWTSDLWSFCRQCDCTCGAPLDWESDATWRELQWECQCCQGHPDACTDYGYLWCECPTCGFLSIQYEGRADRSPCRCPKTGDRGHNERSPRLMRAYTAARQARFERR